MAGISRYNRKEVTGRMRNLIRFLRPLAARGASGEQRQEWIISGEVFADFETRRTGTYEKEEAMRLQSFQSALFHVRYAGTVTTDMRIVFNRREWDIISVRPDPTFSLLTIEAQVRTPREVPWTAPDGQEYVDFDGNPWLFSESGDIIEYVGEDFDEWEDRFGLKWMRRA
jgi:head-tail adaptor